MQNLDLLPQTEIENFQIKALHQLLEYLQRNSAFYQKLFNENNIIIDNIKSISDLQQIPVTSKNDLQNHNWDFLCVEKSEIAEYCTTSGTMGLPVTIALTNNDLERLAYNEFLSFECIGTNSTDILQLMLSLDRQFMAGVAYYSGARKIGAGLVRVGPGNVGMQIETIQRLGTTVLVAVPSFIISLINYAKEKGIDLNKTTVKKIVCIGENIRNEDLSLNSLGAKIHKDWNVNLHSTYASTEKQTAFTECNHGKGGHSHPELLIFEVLDENNKQLPAGEYGELVITTLGVEGMPLLRYKTGDICTYYTEPCACGRNSSRLSPIRGRKQQLLKYSGTTIYPQSIFNVLNGIPEVQDYVIEVTKTNIETDDILINIAVQNHSIEVVNKIKQALQSSLRVLPKIIYLTQDEITKLQFSEGKRKPSKILDLR